MPKTTDRIPGTSKSYNQTWAECLGHLSNTVSPNTRTAVTEVREVAEKVDALADAVADVKAALATVQSPELTDAQLVVLAAAVAEHLKGITFVAGPQ